MSRQSFLILIAAAALAGFSAPLRAQETPPDIRPALAYFPVLPLNAAPDAKPQLMPVAGNHPLDGSHPGFTRAIVVIHDVSRNAQGILADVSALAGSANATTLILAPQFLLASDIDRFYEDLPKELTDKFVTWPMDRWETGGDSVAEAPQQPISSFTALDLILVYLAEKSFFPDLKDIVIAGHGAGADFVQRYAATGRATSVLEKQGLQVRFLVANASSYLYFTGSRPKTGSLGFGSIDPNLCGFFNNYPYGLAGLNGYASGVGTNAIKTDYADRQVTYLTGENAVTDPFPDTSCAAAFEGANRMARGWNYFRYIDQIFGEATTAKQHFRTVPGAGYDPIALFGSPCGMSALFGDGACAAPPTP